DADEDLARRYLDYLGRRSGLFLPRGEGRYAFTHLSFQEYFAACHLESQVTASSWIKERNVPPEVSKKALRSYARAIPWRETLIHLFELLADRGTWSDDLAEELFGVDFLDIPIDPEKPLAGAAPLLATLSTNPYSGLSDDARQRAWTACWSRELEVQQAGLT